jgi:hypothetical protein
MRRRRDLKSHERVRRLDNSPRLLPASLLRLFSALHLLDTLPVSLLELLDQQITKEYKDKRGPMADFMKCYREHLKDEIAEAKVRDWPIDRRKSRVLPCLFSVLLFSSR